MLIKFSNTRTSHKIMIAYKHIHIIHNYTYFQEIYVEKIFHVGLEAMDKVDMNL